MSVTKSKSSQVNARRALAKKIITIALYLGGGATGGVIANTAYNSFKQRNLTSKISEAEEGLKKQPSEEKQIRKVQEYIQTHQAELNHLRKNSGRNTMIAAIVGGVFGAAVRSRFKRLTLSTQFGKRTRPTIKSKPQRNTIGSPRKGAQSLWDSSRRRR